MIDDVLRLIEELRTEFPEVVQVRSIGKTYEGRDIPVVTLEMGPKPHAERTSMLFTGAHHPREAISIHMPFYIIFNMLHKAMNGDQHYIDLLSNHSFHFIPVVNMDGLNYITDNFFITGEYALKRKTMNDSYAG